MKKLTALLTATVILFSLSPAAWAEGDPEPPVIAESIVVPDNPEGETVEEIPGNAAMNNNLGTVIENNGRLEMNNATVETNAGTVGDNRGTVCVNERPGTVAINDGTVKTNDGYVEFNADLIEINSESGIVDANTGKVIFNDGFVIDSGKYRNAEVTFNTNDVQCGRSPDEVKYNAGKVFQYTPSGDDFDELIYYGVVYSEFYTPEDVTKQILLNPSGTNEFFYGHVRGGNLVFTQAVSDSGTPAVITLLTEEESFKKDGYTLDGWLDANNDNAAYTPGETVTVTAPLWLMPNWVLIPVSPSSGESGDSNGSAAREYILVPAGAAQTESWNLYDVSVISSDPRVTKDGELPAAALRLTSELANVIRSCPLRVEFDGEVLPSDSYSLSFHQDGTVTLLFSRSFLSTLSEGEHEITLYLQDAEIYVTLQLTEPTPEETSLRARKAQLSGAFTNNMPQSSAGSKKGKSG